MNQDPNICKSRNQQLLVIPEMDQIQSDQVLNPPSKPFVAIQFRLNKIEIIIVMVFEKLTDN